MNILVDSARIILLFALAATAVASAVVRGAEPIRIQIGGEPSTLDPAQVIDQYGFGILRNVNEGLFALDARGELKRALVATDSLSSDRRTYHFRVRPDARWSDGHPVSALEFALALQRAVDPKVASPDAARFFSIANARKIYSGSLPVSALKVTAQADELTIELEQPDPDFLLKLALPEAAPIRGDLLSENHGQWKEKFPSTGDYFIKNNRLGEKIELSPNPYRAHKGSEIIYQILPEEVTAMNLFESGRVDILSNVSMSEVDRLRSQGLIQTFSSTTVFYLGFNVQKGPTHDLKLRRAIASVVNRADLERLLHGMFRAQVTLVPQTIAPAIKGSELHDAEAVREVKSAKKPRLHLAFGSSEFTRIVTERLQADFKKQLDLDVDLEPTDLKSLLGHLARDPPDIYLLGMSATYRDQTHHLSSFSTELGDNYSRYSNPDFEKLIEKIRGAESSQQRDQWINQANAMIVERDAVIVPLVTRMQVFGVGKKVQGFKVSPYQVIDLVDLSH